MGIAEPRSAERLVRLPEARGPWTRALYALLLGQGRPDQVEEVRRPAEHVLADHDLQMALYLCYELHYAELEGVDPRMEWSPLVLMFRSALESEFEAAVRRVTGDAAPPSGSVGEELQEIVRNDDSPPLSRYVETRASREQILEHIVHRSAYQLKEADPHSWAIPRLSGRAKTALMEIQADEYGGGRPERMHSALFADTMRGVGLYPGYGAYLDHLPGITLATVNLMSWLGLHRELRGALVGHLAAFEMTSSVPNRRYGDGFRRLGFGPEVTAFYDEHVEADAVHESIAAWDLADGLAESEPELAEDILFGARSLLTLEARWAAHLLSSWSQGDSSLLHPL